MDLKNTPRQRILPGSQCLHLPGLHLVIKLYTRKMQQNSFFVVVQTEIIDPTRNEKHFFLSMIKMVVLVQYA